MKNFPVQIAVFLALLFLVTAASIVPAIAPPKTDAMYVPAEESFSFDPTLVVSVAGDCVGKPGTYRIAYGCTYGELFLLAGVIAPPDGYCLTDPVSMAEAVLLGDEYIIYLVL